jgi:type IV pilus assembly protein PilO
MNKYLAQLASLDWPKVLAIGVALAAGYYFLMYDNGSTLEDSIKKAQDRVVAAKKSLGDTQKAMDDANNFAKEVEQTKVQFDKITQYMPASMSGGELTKLINEISQDVGVRPRIAPRQEEAPLGFTQAFKVDLQLEGSYAQILTFLAKISQEPRLLVFDKVELVPNSSGGIATSQGSALTFKGTLIGYKYLPDAADPAEAPTAPGAPMPKAGGT